MAEIFKIVDGIRYQAVVINSKILHWRVIANISNQNDYILIQDSIDGVPVKTIEANVFCNNNRLTVVCIPSSILSIKQNAFKNCQRLTSVSIYTSNIDNELGLISLHGGTFEGCHSLKSISTNIPIRLNGKSVFAECMALETIGSENKVWGDFYADVFKDCWSLKKLHIAGSTCRFWSRSLSGCPNLQEIIIEAAVIQLPKSILNILSQKHITCYPQSTVSELAYSGAKISFIED